MESIAGYGPSLVQFEPAPLTTDFMHVGPIVSLVSVRFNAHGPGPIVSLYSAVPAIGAARIHAPKGANAGVCQEERPIHKSAFVSPVLRRGFRSCGYRTKGSLTVSRTWERLKGTTYGNELSD